MNPLLFGLFFGLVSFEGWILVVAISAVHQFNKCDGAEFGWYPAIAVICLMIIPCVICFLAGLGLAKDTEG